MCLVETLHGLSDKHWKNGWYQRLPSHCPYPWRGAVSLQKHRHSFRSKERVQHIDQYEDKLGGRVQHEEVVDEPWLYSRWAYPD